MLEGYINPTVKNRNGDLKSSSNYREVMISNNMFKVFEYVLLPLVKKYCSLNSCQFGYRKSTSTLMAIALFKETVTRYNSEGSPIYSCFLDMSKAFERVDHELLLKKLANKNVPVYLLNIIKLIFLNSSVCVKFDSILSDSWSIKSGVRQGGILSAYLFCIFIDDILDSINQCQFGCKLGITPIKVLAYADDIVLVAPTIYGLQQLLNKTETLLNNAKLVLNVDKTVAMVFRPRPVSDTHIRFFINDNIINIVDSVKYLGCILSKNFNDSLDIDRSYKAFNKSAGFLIRKFYYADIDVLYYLFNSYCTSFYGSELWTFRNKCKPIFKEFSVSYHAALKKILGVPKFYSNHFVCSIFNTITFTHMINFKMVRFLYNLKNTSSPCFYIFRYYFLHNSFYYRFITDQWKNDYNVENILANDIDALYSRILYVQNREPISMYFLNS